jgi:hypothetical protein
MEQNKLNNIEILWRKLAIGQCKESIAIGIRAVSDKFGRHASHVT